MRNAQWKMEWILSSCIVPLLFFSTLCGETESQRTALLATLDKSSLRQHLAFYDLYSDTPEGKEALRRAWGLLCATSYQKPAETNLSHLSSITIQQMISILGNGSLASFAPLPAEDIVVIEKLAQHLPNRKLRGFSVNHEEDLLNLTPDQIEISQAVLLSQGEAADFQRLASYKASLDLMALQILARIGIDATPIDKINGINAFIFEELGYRFPPHSLYAKDIDQYTFLSSIIDKREGVCLGVSILYLSLAQRIGLPLEIITPPGHIYVRYNTPTYHINIETTARGVHLDDHVYLGINTRSLSQRNLKEVVGMIHYNQASVYWQKGENEKVAECYKKAYVYMHDDLRLQELIAINALVLGKKEEANQILLALQNKVDDDEVARDPLAQDILDYSLDAETINTIMMPVDETRSSILKKKEALLEALEKYPKARSLHFNLAATLMQLNRHKEALERLKIYHKLDPNNPHVEYYLAALSAQRLNYPDAWHHLKRAELLTGIRGYQPRVLKHFRRELSAVAPEKI